MPDQVLVVPADGAVAAAVDPPVVAPLAPADVAGDNNAQNANDNVESVRLLASRPAALLLRPWRKCQTTLGGRTTLNARSLMLFLNSVAPLQTLTRLLKWYCNSLGIRVVIEGQN